MNPLSLTELADIVDGRLIAACDSLDACVTRTISIDSRSLQQGEVFLALVGRNGDGHDFVDHARQRGAAAAIVERSSNAALPQIVVSDTRAALWRMARWQRQNSDTLVIGITGSVGKTSTRNMLHGVLSTQFQGQQSPQNFNNELGVPLSLLQMNADDEFAVIEIAANRPGEIARLADLAQPEIGILTSIGPAHLEGFGSLAGVIQEKSQLLAALPASGLAVLPDHLAVLPGIRTALNSRIITIGTGPNCTLAGNESERQSGGLSFQIGETNFHLPVQGGHLLTSALICVAIGRELGLSDTQIQTGFNRFSSMPGRANIKATSFGCIIDDSYNANPLSMTAGLELLRYQANVHRRIAVLGDMAELGPESVSLHRKVGHRVANSACDCLITYGPLACEIARGAHTAGMSASRIACFETISDLMPILSLWIEPGTAVLVKGSRSMRMETIVAALEANTQASQIRHAA